MLLATPYSSCTGRIFTLSIAVAAWAALIVTLYLSTPLFAHHTQPVTSTAAAAQPDLTIELSTKTESVSPGDVVVFSITYRNQGPTDAADVQITVIVPNNTSFLERNSDPHWTCSAGGIGGAVCVRPIDVVRAQSVGPEPLIFSVQVDRFVPSDVRTIESQFELSEYNDNDLRAGGSPARISVIPVNQPTALAEIEEPAAEPDPRAALSSAASHTKIHQPDLLLTHKEWIEVWACVVVAHPGPLWEPAVTEWARAVCEQES